MVCFRINIEVMRKVGAQQKETFRGWFTISPFDKVSDITTTS